MASHSKHNTRRELGFIGGLGIQWFLVGLDRGAGAGSRETFAPWGSEFLPKDGDQALGRPPLIVGNLGPLGPLAELSWWQYKPDMVKRMMTWGLAFAALSLGACSRQGGSANDTDAGSGAGATSTEQGSGSGPAVPTYYQHVAPIYARRCVGCHQEGGAGPFRLDTYASAKAMARASANSVKAKSMPPWLVRDDGQCGEYKDSQALSEAEIGIIARWADAGAPEGQKAEVSFPPVKSLKDFVEVSTPRYVPEAKGGSLAQSDEYRCFLLKNPVSKKRQYLNGHEVVPGNAAIVHHAVMMVVPGQMEAIGGGQTNAQRIQALDDQSPDKAGWPCYGSAGEGVQAVDLPVVWAPGQGAVELAKKTGSIVDPTDLLVLQVHYNLADPKVVGQSDATKLRMRFIDSIERQSVGFPWDDLIETLAGGSPAMIPPDQEAFVYQTDKSFEGFGFTGLPYVDIQGFMPHMHGAGKAQRIERVVNRSSQCLSDVPVWDFDWQLAYFFKHPIRIKPGETLRNVCTFNTKNRTEPTSPGWGTGNEMCLATLFMLYPPGFESR